jgi:hypothetical protein
MMGSVSQDTSKEGEASFKPNEKNRRKLRFFLFDSWLLLIFGARRRAVRQR